MQPLALPPTACPVHYPFLKGGPLPAVDLHRLSREEADREVQRLASQQEPGIQLITPYVFAFFAVRNLLELAPAATEATLSEIFRATWPTASPWFRSALEVGYTNSLRALGRLDAEAQVQAAVLDLLKGY